jgi:DNA-binding transcriptional ArsR family regulator
MRTVPPASTGPVFFTTEGRLDAAFAALADPTRRAIVARLARGEAPVTALAAPFALSLPAISKHLKVLERAGLVARGRDAQRRPCRLEPAALAVAAAWIDRQRRLHEARLTGRASSSSSKRRAVTARPGGRKR